MTAREIIDTYIKFFEGKNHKRIQNSPLVPENDPTTLFTSSGMQPLVPFLLGEVHPQGKRLVNVQNCFRANDIDEVGDNRHTTFFRMLGNWSLGDYFKEKEIPWLWEFFTRELGLSKDKLYISIYDGSLPLFETGTRDLESEKIWGSILTQEGLNPKERIFDYREDKNWWSRSGEPKNMPVGEIGGPDTEVFYDFGKELKIHENSGFKDKVCHPNCNCGRFLEIGNAVFIQAIKITDANTFKELEQKNVDFGGGLERLLSAAENKNDIFQSSLFSPIIQVIEKTTKTTYEGHEKIMRITLDHFIAAIFMISSGIKPAKTEQGYILRRLIRRGMDSFRLAHGADISAILEKIVEQYVETDPNLKDNFEKIKLTILEEVQNYRKTIERAEKLISNSLSISPSISASPSEEDHSTDVVKEITSDEAFNMYSTHGLSPTQIKNLGYVFNEQEFAGKMEEHQKLSREGAGKRFKGGLADESEKTIAGHTATHLLHQALKDVLGEKVNQAGSNITNERVRFDFTYDEKLTDEQLKKIEKIVNDKIKENLKVKVEIMPLAKAKGMGAVGLFNEKYQDEVKVYTIGAYSTEICGGPHVDFTGKLKRFRIIRQENIGHGLKRIYAKVG